MGCFSCFKPSTSDEDTFEAETDIARQMSYIDAHVQEDEQVALAILRSEQEEDKDDVQPSQEEKVNKTKQFQEQVNKDEQLPPPPPLEEHNNISSDAQRIISDKAQTKRSKDEVKDAVQVIPPPPPSMCGGCHSEIEDGGCMDVLGVPWHRECFYCRACHIPLAINEVENHVSNSRGKFHKNCYGRYCYVCEEKVMTKDYKFNQHLFWKESYCVAHETDRTPKCFSCERLKPRGSDFVMLDDGRWLCLECMESAVMDSYEVQPLHFEIREFFQGLNMNIHKEFSLLLVEKQALNQAEKEEKIDNQHSVVTRGICLSEEQIVTSVSKRPKIGANNQLTGMATESGRVVSGCPVTAILILYGLPRLLTGFIMAHEMMHAYFRLNGYNNMNKVIEEGICQVLGHMWLETQRYAPIDVASVASSSSSNASKKGESSVFEKQLVDFFQNQIETYESPVYGVGFRKVNSMVTNSNLQETLKEILRHHRG